MLQAGQNNNSYKINKLDLLSFDFAKKHKNAIFFGSQFFKANEKVKSSQNKAKNKNAKYFKDGFYLEYIAREEAVSKDDKSKVYDFLGEEIELNKAKEQMSKINDNQLIWENVLSFDDSTKELINFDNKKEISNLIQKPLTQFWKDNGFNPKNMNLVFSIHRNTDHPHIHFAFWEKEPSYLNQLKNREKIFRAKGKLSEETFLTLKQNVFVNVLEHKNEKDLYTSPLISEFKNIVNQEQFAKDEAYASFYLWLEQNKTLKEIKFKFLKQEIQSLVKQNVANIISSSQELQESIQKYYKQTQIVNEWIQEEINTFNENQKIASWQDKDDSNFKYLEYTKLNLNFVKKELENKLCNAFIKSVQFKQKKSKSCWYKKQSKEIKSKFENSTFDIQFQKSKKFKSHKYLTKKWMYEFTKENFDIATYLNGKIFENQQQQIIDKLHEQNKVQERQ